MDEMKYAYTFNLKSNFHTRKSKREKNINIHYESMYLRKQSLLNTRRITGCARVFLDKEHENMDSEKQIKDKDTRMEMEIWVWWERRHNVCMCM